MSDDRDRPEAGDAGQPAADKRRTEEQIGRTLGGLFGRLKRTGTYRRAERAYRDAVEGKDEEPPAQ
ncbi:MAG: hypothetical protein HY331_04680 [Chloroflexi bacterium]|nr:hypothetical protein [Chloroflexota bacterium]